MSDERISETEGSQPDYVMLALLRIGGAEHFVDIEHLAVEAYRLAPTLFRWRHYPEFPSVEVVRTALRHARDRSEVQLYIAGDGGRSRMLTAAGLERARNFERSLQLSPTTPEEGTLRRPVNRELLRMERHPGFAKWKSQGIGAVNRHDLADLLACSPSSGREVFIRRLERVRTIAVDWGRAELAAFLKACLEVVDRVLEEVEA